MKIRYNTNVEVRGGRVLKNSIADGYALTPDEQELEKTLKPLLNQWVRNYLQGNQEYENCKIVVAVKCSFSASNFSADFKVQGVLINESSQ